MNTRIRRPRQEGFSFIEILVACAIIAVLLGLLLPAYRGVANKAESVRCLMNLRHVHGAFMLFYADHHFFPLGYSDDTTPPPGSRWSVVRHPHGITGTYTQWQIEIAPYLGNGLVEEANWIVHPDHKTMPAATAWNSEGADPSAWRLPMELRCPGYNRKLAGEKFDWERSSQRVRQDHYGYCYNQYVMVGNGKPEASYTTGEEQHKGRDPRFITSGYAASNTAADTLLLFCSRWGVWQSKVGISGSDISGVFAGEADFSGYPLTNPHGAAGAYSGVAAGIHGGTDNFLFLDGHVEILNRLKAADRRRMNKTFWRPLPIDTSFGHYGWNSSADYQVAYAFDDDGRPMAQLSTDGVNMSWWPSAPPAGYNWNN